MLKKTKQVAVPALGDLPATMPIPECGKLFFGASLPASYRLARAGVIPTIETGSRNKRALPRVLARKLGMDAA
jgi:hypothetical protein